MPKGLGGVMGWSLGEDTFDNSHILAIQAGVQSATAGSVAKRDEEVKDIKGCLGRRYC